MTPQEPYLAPRACRFDDKRGYGNLSGSVGDTADGRPSRGRLIVIEGLDGSGKQTQAGLL